MRDDENDLGFDSDFFKERSKVKNPRKLKASAKTEEVIEKQKVSKKKFSRGNAYQHTKTGSRSDLQGIVARSSWEADVMRVLNLFKIEFQFEPYEFQFPPDVRGRTSAYLPDIYLTKSDEFIEVKGYLDARGRNKLRKFKKYYPEEFKKLVVIISKSNKANKFFFKKLGVKTVLYYEHLIKLFADKIPNWEGKK
jgi:hypothetical protein